jgi:hypothetical protein
MYFSPNIIRVIKSRKMRWVGKEAHVRDSISVYRVLVEKPERKRPLGRPRRRWNNNIKMHLQEVGAQTRMSWLRIGTGGGHL